MRRSPLMTPMRFTLPFVALAAACSTPSAEVPRNPTPISNAAAGADPMPLAIEGDHRTKHPIGLVCDGGSGGWCEEEVEDRLAIRVAHDSAIAVAIHLIQTNVHSCTFEGELAPATAPRPHVRRWRFEGQTDDGPCALLLDVTDHAIQISSTGCRYYCGARASLDAVFPI